MSGRGDENWVTTTTAAGETKRDRKGLGTADGCVHLFWRRPAAAAPRTHAKRHRSPPRADAREYRVKTRSDTTTAVPRRRIYTCEYDERKTNVIRTHTGTVWTRGEYNKLESILRALPTVVHGRTSVCQPSSVISRARSLDTETTTLPRDFSVIREHRRRRDGCL